MDVGIAPRSSLLGTNVPDKERLYGYHRIENPPVVYLEKGNLKVTPCSEIEREEEVVVSIHGRQDNVNIVQPVEPKSY